MTGQNHFLPSPSGAFTCMSMKWAMCVKSNKILKLNNRDQSAALGQQGYRGRAPLGAQGASPGSKMDLRLLHY